MTRMLWILAVLLSHWRRHPMQLATLLIGLISATALWSGVQALNQQARDSYDRAAATFGGARTATLVSRNGTTFPQKLFVDLRRAGWPVSPVLEGRVQIDGRSFRLLGIEPVTLPAEVGNAPAIGRADLQSFLTPPGETLVAPEVLADLNLPEGATPLAGDDRSLPPLRAQAQLVPGVLVVDIGVAQRLLDMPDQISRLLIGKIRSKPTPLESVAGDQLRLVQPDAESDLERLTDSFHLNLTAFGLLSFVVGLFIVNSAIGLAFEQRLPMLRTLRACGVSARMLNAVLLVELVSLALVAGMAGLVCGYLIAAALLPDVAASLRGLYGAQIPGQLTLRAEWWIAGIIISVVGALLAATTSLLKAIRLSVLAAAQPYAWQQAQHRWLVLQSAAGARRARRRRLVSVVRRFAGFGICRARGTAAWRGAWPARDPGAPAFARPAAGSSRARGLVLGRQPPAAFGIVAGVDGAVARARGQCRCRHHGGNLQPDVYQLAGWTAGSGRLHQCIRRCAGYRHQSMAARASRSRGDPARRPGRGANGGAPIEILAIADHATYRDHWPLLESTANAWTRLRPGDAGLISEQLARRLKLAIGDSVEVPARGGNWALEIVGIYADYGNPKGQIAVNIAAFTRRFPEIPLTRMGLRVAPAAVPALMSSLQEKFGLDGRNLLDQATLKAESTRIFNRTFAVTAALNAFTLGVAGVALLTSLLTLSNSRLPQLAPLWAIGITRRRLAAIELLKTMSVALITTLLALPLGLLVAWCLIAVVNVKAFGWRLPFHVFPLQLLQLLGVAMAASLLAAVLPVVKLARMQPTRLIKIFADER